MSLEEEHQPLGSEEFGPFLIRFVDALEKTRDRVQEHGVDLVAIKGTLERIEGHLETLNGRTSTVETRTGSVEARLTQRERNIPLAEHLHGEFKEGLERIDTLESFRDRLVGIVVGASAVGGLVGGAVSAVVQIVAG